MSYTINTNTKYNSIEITFDCKPSQEVREALKALKFRWNNNRGLWYGFADMDTVKNAIGGESIRTKETKKAKKTEAQNHIKIYWNGLKVDGGKMIRCGYSLDNNADRHESVSIYAKDYDDLPRDLFKVENETDLYTDYFDTDRAEVLPNHPLYKYIRYAAEKAQARTDRAYCESLRKTLSTGRERWAGQFENLRKDLARREAFIAKFEKTEDPGQPTAEDVESIDRQRQEEENAREAARLAEEQREREAFTCQRVNGKHLIDVEASAHPVESGKPSVIINWSEHPAFSSFKDDSLRLSITAAENILSQLDEEQHRTRGTVNGSGWYYKTAFTIECTDENGETCTYSGRYDLGDGENGLINHIRNFGKWNLSHDVFGRAKAPEETNDIIKFADFLTECINGGNHNEE